MGATFSDCQKYRYLLTRNEQFNDRPAVFCLLNPSIAGEVANDPTTRRLENFTYDLGFTCYVLMNAYAYCATDPANLWKAADPVGSMNDYVLHRIAAASRQIICAWGANIKPERQREVVGLFRSAGAQLLCFGINKNGTPKHPLYLKSSTILQPWEPT